jgi:hypothetical protein
MRQIEGAALTMVINHELDITHNLCITAVRLVRHLSNARTISKDSGGLRVKNKRDCEEAFDPFCCLVSWVVKGGDGGWQVRRGELEKEGMMGKIEWKCFDYVSKQVENIPIN